MRQQRLPKTHRGPFLGLAVLWEMNVWFWRFQNYTPIFHFAALAAGFLIARYLFPRNDRDEDRAPDRRSPATATA